MTTQKPSIGRIVHYHSRGSADGVFKSEPRAAIITQVHEGTSDEEGVELVGLAVLNPNGLFFQEYTAYSGDQLPGCWSWPPQVGPARAWTPYPEDNDEKTEG